MHYSLFHTLLLFICLATLQSCSLVKNTPKDFNNQLEKWLSQDEFYKIEKAFKKIPENDRRYHQIIKRKPEVAAQKKFFINETSRLGREYVKNNQWQKAIDTHTSAIEKLDSSESLEKELKLLVKERDAKTLKLKCDLLIKHSKQLISNSADYRLLNQYNPHDNDIKLDTNRFKKTVSRTADKLDDYTEQAIDNQQLTLAKRCAQAAYDISPSSDRRKQFKKIEKSLGLDNVASIHNRLFEKYEAAYKKQNYIEAQKYLESILKSNPTHGKAKYYLNALGREIELIASEKIKIGKELYSQKKIKEALKIWKHAKSLLPNDKDLDQLILRAEKVSKKIKSLEYSQ